MPQSIHIDLPLVISGRGGLTLVRPLGFPDIALAAGTEDAALRTVRRRVIKRCSGFVGSQLIGCLVRGNVQRRTIGVAISPEKNDDDPMVSLSWRDPIEIGFDAFVWTQDDSLLVAYISDLDLTVVATPQTDLEKLVQEQIRSAIRRQNLWSLMGLSSLDHGDEVRFHNESITLELPTPTEFARQQQEKPKTKTPTLSAVATRLIRKTLLPAYYRDSEVEQLAGLLSSTQSRSVLLVGPSGVGKTAIFHEWVRRRNQFGDPSMAGVTCWATDGSRLISGQSGFGMWQQQCLQMADEARRYPSVIHLGNLVQLSESGRLRGSGGCGALLAPRLADGSLKAVIECTPEQWTRISRVEPRLVQALTTLRIEEPTSEQTRSILLEAATAWRPVDVGKEIQTKRKRRRSQQKSDSITVNPKGVREQIPRVDPVALQVLDRLHRRFRTDAAAPGRPLAFFHALMSELLEDQTLDERRVVEAFGRQTGLPSFLIDDSVRPDLVRIEQQLKSQVVGQDSVIETLVDMIATLAADLSRGDRPLASMMLIGPTGVGKTETAKALARLIYSDVSRLVRIDMSELSSPTAVGRLIGDAMHPEGLLTSAVRAQPFSLVLLDEFEKAHPSVFDLLLQVLGEGRLTDGRGRLADFRNSIVLMTSNLGVESFKTVPLGLAETQQTERYRNHFQRQVRDFLRPELFNRIDRILTYDPLAQETVQQIARLRIDEVKNRDGWQSHGHQFQIDEAALKNLAECGYQPQFGARPLTREVELRIVAPLSEAICLSGRSRRLDALVTTLSDPNHPDQAATLTVEFTPTECKEKQFGQDVISRLEEMTMLRRRGQALLRCDAVRRLRNQYTMVSRKIKTLLRSSKNEDHRERIRYGPLGVDRMQTHQRIVHVRHLCHDIEKAEATLLAMHYRGQAIDPHKVADKIDSIRERLWDTLCELQSGTSAENQRVSLALSASNLNAADILIQAYRRIAQNRGWTLQTHALLRREKSAVSADRYSPPDLSDERKIDSPGWSREPAFRVSTTGEQSIVADIHGQFPSLAAYRCLDFSALTSFPQGTLSLLMTFRGKNACLMMGGEAGVHTFAPLQTAKSEGNSILIRIHEGMPIEYIAPEWLPRRDFQLSGQPRRWYAEANDVVQDLTEGNPRAIKLDREGKWLETLIENETERRVWAELDQDQESARSDLDLDVEIADIV